MSNVPPYTFSVYTTNETGAYYIGYDFRLHSADVTGKINQVEYHPSAGAGGELEKGPDTYYESGDY